MVCAGFTSTQATNNRAARVRKLVRSAVVFPLILLALLAQATASIAVAPASIAPTSIPALASTPALQPSCPATKTPDDVAGLADRAESSQYSIPADPRGHAEREGYEGREGLAGRLRAG